MNLKKVHFFKRIRQLSDRFFCTSCLKWIWPLQLCIWKLVLICMIVLCFLLCWDLDNYYYYFFWLLQMSLVKSKIRNFFFFFLSFLAFYNYRGEAWLKIFRSKTGFYFTNTKSYSLEIPPNAGEFRICSFCCRCSSWKSPGDFQKTLMHTSCPALLRCFL